MLLTALHNCLSDIHASTPPFSILKVLPNPSIAHVLKLTLGPVALAAIRPAREIRSGNSKAKSVYQKILTDRPKDTLALAGLATVYSKKRDWENAAQAWENLLRIVPDNLEANSERWYALIQASKDDSVKLDRVKETVTEEALDFLRTLDDRRMALALAYDGLRIAEAESVKVAEVEQEIIRSFPQSKKGYEITTEKFFDGLYPIWRDDTLKVIFLGRFLQEYQANDWRLTVYQYLLSSLKRLDDVDGVRHYGERMLREDSLNPFAYHYLSYILLEMSVDTSRALELAMRAVELEPGYSKPQNKPLEQWKLEKSSLPGTARREVATALMAMGKLNEAERWIKDALRVMRPSVNDFATRASLFYTLGRILEEKDDDDSALGAYVKALIEGDMTNKWTEKADSAFKTVYTRRFGGEQGLMEYARRVSAYNGITFTDVTEEVGLGGRGESRIAWSDFNNDGFDDILLNGRVLFLNSQGDSFADHTDKSGIGDSGTNGAVCADFDNDGNMDFYATSGGKGEKKDRLWKGKGDGTFMDVTETAGTISDTFPTEGAAWGDYEADGHIDLYCANYETWRKASGLPDFLYHNNGDGTFSNVTGSTGIEPPFGEDRAGRGVNWGDFDNDGDLDIYVSDYRLQENLLFKNDGNGRFTNVAALLGVAGDERNGWWGHTIGSEWGDFDNDGDLDLVTANLAHPRYIEVSNKTRLYENMGWPDWNFVDRREMAGIRYDETHSDPSWGDVDADGDLDLYVTSIYRERRSFLYENLGDGTFRDITWLAGVRAFNGWGCAFSDYDNDGDLDLFVASGSGVHLFRNDGNGNRWLEVGVVGGRKSNKAAIGARLTAKQGRKIQIREVQGGKGTTNQHSLVQFFGFGADSSPVDVVVRFPSGKVVKRRRVSTNQRIVIKER